MDHFARFLATMGLLSLVAGGVIAFGQGPTSANNGGAIGFPIAGGLCFVAAAIVVHAWCSAQRVQQDERERREQRDA